MGIFLDPDDDLPVTFKVISLPENGKLVFNDFQISQEDKISFFDLGRLRFEPRMDWFGNTAFEFAISDGSSWSEPATVSIRITAPPLDTLLIIKQGQEDQVLEFDASDLSQYKDVLTPASLIRLNTSPKHGDLRFDPQKTTPDHSFSGLRLSAGEEMTLANLVAGELIFSPDPDWYGETEYYWTIKPESGGNSIPEQIVTIKISPVDDAPVVTNNHVSGKGSMKINFTPRTFTDSFHDVDDDVLSRIRITQLPRTGKLKFNGTKVVTEDEIPVTEIENLVFRLAADHVETSDEFAWQGSDGQYWSNTAFCVLTTSMAPSEPSVPESEIPEAEGTTFPSPPGLDCQHATYDAATQTLTLPALDIPIFDPTHQQMLITSVFSCQMTLIPSAVGDLRIDGESLSIQNGIAADPACHARFDGFGKILIPALDFHAVFLLPGTDIIIKGPKVTHSLVLRQAPMYPDVFYIESVGGIE